LENVLKFFFRNPIENFAMPNAQKVWRLLRYALTGIVGEVEDWNLAQAEALTRRPSDSEQSEEWETWQ